MEWFPHHSLIQRLYRNQIDNPILTMLIILLSFDPPQEFPMADILPFRGLIYDLNKIGDLSLVTSPPYDVISEKALPGYYTKHPYNIVRLELGDRSSGQDRYRLCAQHFNDWLKRGILIREQNPAFYFYEVDFSFNGAERRVRQGFIGLCRLEEFEKGMILPHERIHEEQKEDRLRVLKSCQANLTQSTPDH